MNEAATSVQAKIQVRGLRKAFGSKVVLDDLDLDIADGESLVVIGGSGSGKSVLIKSIIGLIEPDAGSIKVDGLEHATMSPAQRQRAMAKFGLLFQGGALFDSLPVWQNVAFGLMQVNKIDRQEARATAVETLARVGLPEEVANLMPAELSGGMQKRVSLARAIATQPGIIFFDEPTTGLDPIMGSVIDNLIVDSVRRLGATALSITHDMASARRIADRVAMIYGGKIIWSGPVTDIDDCPNPFVDQFVHGRAEGPIKMQVRT